MSLILTVAIVATMPAVTADTLDSVTVVASRRPQPVASVLADVTVIEREQIDISQAPDLLELLRRLPGVDFARTGGSGQQTSAFLRGSNFNHVLFLVDGVRVASANTGAAAFEHLPIDQIERIEIVRGPRASYYGSDAIGGVIAITTRERVGGAALLRIGSQGRGAALAAYGVSGDRGALSVQVGGENYDGFSSQTPDGFSYDPDDDGYKNRNLGLRARLTLGSQRLSFSGLATDSDSEFDQGESHADQYAIGATLEGPISDPWSHRLSVGSARDDLDTPAFFARFLTRRQQLDWVNDVEFASAQHVVFGVNLQRERGENLDTFAAPATRVFRESLQHQAVFAAWQGANGNFDHELVVRYDDHESFGGEVTAQAALGWRFDGGRVFASWGEGLRAPNLNELYSPGFSGLFGGNPDLDPEHSRSAELGVDWRMGEFDLGANVYRTRIRDLVVFEGGQTFQAINIARAAIDGVELTLDRNVGAWSFGTSATWQHPRNEDTDAELLRRPEHKAAVDLGYRFETGIHVGGDVAYVSERADFGADLGSYSVVGLHADWPFAEGWTLGARLSNIGDRDYQWAAGFAAPGAEAIVTLSWQQQP